MQKFLLFEFIIVISHFHFSYFEQHARIYDVRIPIVKNGSNQQATEDLGRRALGCK